MDEWCECVTPEGHVYWFNRKTEESSWDPPAGIKSTSGNDGMIWIPHPEEGYLPGKVSRDCGEGSCEVTTNEGETIWLKMRPSMLEKVVSSTLEKNVDDLVQMEHINEAMIVHNLRKRFKNDQIYTNIGTILISVNPFKKLPLYTPTVMDQYMHKGVKEMPPHTFNIADNAYKAMIEKKKNQSVLISGESGAGKTECTKQCLMYFAELAGSTNGVEQFILLANPILEAFGNAKTLRNNNSSRFGKWVEIHFDTSARICGASTVNYLLEKSRVVYQIKGERNFHIFYQLVAGLDQETLAKWNLKSAEHYNYINTSGCITIDGVDDAKDFEEVKEAMVRLSFKPEEINDVFQLTAAVLQLGNLMFGPEMTSSGPDASKSVVTDKGQAQIVADLLGVNSAALEAALTSRLMEIRGCAPTRIPLTPEQARDACDALAKALYGRLFDWIVRRINQSMKPSSTQTTVIGVLDIFGFEIFQKNSFEQLCINFTNEKLQQHFNQYTFKLEEALYQSEEIKYEHIKFIDNQPVLDLIEKKTPQGVMLTLDEQLWVPKGSDATFILACNKTHGMKQNANYAEVRTSNIEFVIKHYAGDVTYDATGFLDKNKDTLQKDLLVVVEGTTNQFISVMFPVIPDADRRTSKVTLGSQFRRQLEDLMTALNTTEPHFIRAIKPNMEKVPNKFQGTLSLQQLRYAGVFEAVKIRQTGYPFRYPHLEFLQRYAILNKAIAKDNTKDLKTRCSAIIKSLKGDFSEVQVGKTRILYRANSHRSFELLRNIQVEKLCVLIQKHHRRHMAQRLLKRIKLVKAPLDEALKSRDIDKLKAALEKAKDIEFKIKLIADCEKLLNFLVKEKELNRKLNELIGGEKGEGQQMAVWEKIFDELSGLVAEADEIELDNDIVKRGREIVTFVKGKKECLKMFEEATKESNKEVLITAIKKGRDLGLSEDEPLFIQAKNELARIEKEEVLLQALEVAIGTGAARVINSDPKEWDHSTISTAGLEDAIREANAFGVRTAAGKKRLTEGQLLVDLRKALLSEDWEAVKAVLMKAASMPYNSDEISHANEEVATKAASKEIIGKLVEATQTFDLEAMAYGIQQAIAMQLSDAPEVVEAEKLLKQATTAKLALQSALESSVLDDLELAVALARPFAFLAEDVARAEALGKSIYENDMDARVALFFMERPMLDAVYDKAHATKLESNLIKEIRDALSLDPTKFIQLQLKVANRLGDHARAIRLQIQLKELFFAQFKKMFVLHEWKRLRDPDSFAKTKMFGRETLRRGMLSWTKDPIPTSLTLLDLPYAKQVVRLFKNVQGFMGDKALSYPNALAQDLLDQGLSTPEIRDEIYCQIIKQLTDNDNHMSMEKGWLLMGMCLQTFPPSDDFVNYLELFLKEKGKSNNFVGMLHDTQYTAQKSEAPNVDLLLPTLHSTYNPWILLDVVPDIRPELVPADFNGWAGAGSPRRSATGIKDAVANFGTIRDIFYGAGSSADPGSEAGGGASPQPHTWREEALDQVGKPKGQTIFALWKMEKGGSHPVASSTAAADENVAVVDVGVATIRPGSAAAAGTPLSPESRRARPIRGTLRDYSPIEASRPRTGTVQPNLRMQTLRGERPSTPDMDSQATLRKFNEENVKRVLVMYDFDGGGDPKKLRIQRGAVITVLKEYSGWGMGELNGKQGLYPLNYVKPIE